MTRTIRRRRSLSPCQVLPRCHLLGQAGRVKHFNKLHAVGCQLRYGPYLVETASEAFLLAGLAAVFLADRERAVHLAQLRELEPCGPKPR